MKSDFEELRANASILLISAAMLLMKPLMNGSSVSIAKTRNLRLLKAKQLRADVVSKLCAMKRVILLPSSRPS